MAALPITTSLLLFTILSLSLFSHAQQLTLLQPMSLVRTDFNETKGKLQSTLGYYGHLNYGSERISKVFIPTNGTRIDGCNELKESDFVQENDTVQRELFRERSAIMVKRGGCTFVQKSVNI